MTQIEKVDFEKAGKVADGIRRVILMRASEIPISLNDANTKGENDCAGTEFKTH